MKRHLYVAGVAVLSAIIGFFAAPTLHATKEDSKMLVHNVFFTLKDPTPENVKKLVDNCKKYLVDHEGMVYFGAGERIKELDRDVNDKDYHVGLHLIFKDKACQDKYQTAPLHVKFIEESKDLWAKVRVFDNDLQVHEKGK